MSSSKVVPNGEKADVMDALTRYYAATNVAMLLPKEPEVIKEAITDFCAVTDEKKSELRAHWQHAVSNGRALCACALCGQRDLSSLYEQMHVAALPSFFELDAASVREFDVLKSGVRLMSASGVLQDELTDLSAIMSSYCTYQLKAANVTTCTLSSWAAKKKSTFAAPALSWLRSKANPLRTATNLKASAAPRGELSWQMHA